MNTHNEDAANQRLSLTRDRVRSTSTVAFGLADKKSKKIDWIRVAVFIAIAGIVAHGPLRYARLHSVFGPLFGSTSAFGDGPWSNPLALSIAGFMLAIFTISCSQSTRYREILVSILGVSLTLFPQTLAFLFAGVMGIAIATPFIFMFARVALAVKYYTPTKRGAEHSSAGDVATRAAPEE